ncbi:hypothetical protein EB796_018819 [Bugula neritina]|uniref:Uncharacterized protein n=1 Tax=Bugula neritina TaxID=10212 RepID=A0A7J7JA09_BUGNE|nr:hypothetical protein EB796_018819 [Bugula neritina]
MASGKHRSCTELENKRKQSKSYKSDTNIDRNSVLPLISQFYSNNGHLLDEEYTFWSHGDRKYQIIRPTQAMKFKKHIPNGRAFLQGYGNRVNVHTCRTCNHSKKVDTATSMPELKKEITKNDSSSVLANSISLNSKVVSDTKVSPSVSEIGLEQFVEKTECVTSELNDPTPCELADISKTSKSDLEEEKQTLTNPELLDNSLCQDKSINTEHHLLGIEKEKISREAQASASLLMECKNSDCQCDKIEFAEKMSSCDQAIQTNDNSQIIDECEVACQWSSPLYEYDSFSNAEEADKQHTYLEQYTSTILCCENYHSKADCPPNSESLSIANKSVTYKFTNIGEIPVSDKSTMAYSADIEVNSTHEEGSSNADPIESDQSVEISQATPPTDHKKPGSPDIIPSSSESGSLLTSISSTHNTSKDASKISDDICEQSVIEPPPCFATYPSPKDFEHINPLLSKTKLPPCPEYSLPLCDPPAYIAEENHADEAFSKENDLDAALDIYQNYHVRKTSECDVIIKQIRNLPLLYTKDPNGGGTLV